MHLHPFTIERLTLELTENSSYKIVGTKLANAFTTDKETLFLQFDTVAIKLSFFRGEALFQFPEIGKLQKKNRLGIFKELLNLKVIQIRSYRFERGFDILFEDNFRLTFYLFGKFSQVSLYYNQYLHHYPVSRKAISEHNLTEINTKNLTADNTDRMRFLTEDERNRVKKLITRGDVQTVETIINKPRKEALSSDYNLVKTDRGYTLTQENVSSRELISSYKSVAQALNDFSRLYISFTVFNEAKRNKLGAISQQIKKAKNRIKSLELKLSKLKHSVSNREKADLIMANLYRFGRNESEYVLTSFDGLREVRIKASSQLSPQANAERYYKKAKNQSKEVDFINRDIENTISNLESLEKEYQNLLTETDYKKIVSKKNESDTGRKQRLPFSRRLIDGYEVRIGKSAKDNDVLLRTHSSKNDVWMHAKGVSGSHVIIRNSNKKAISASTIEKVASIAAFYSKAKNEALAAVIYTDRKYVRKPKGANPGAVVVEKEEVVLVKPENLIT